MTYPPPPGEQPQYGPPPEQSPPGQVPGYPPQANPMMQQPGYAAPQQGLPGQTAAGGYDFRATRDPLPAFMLFGLAGVTLLVLIFDVVQGSTLYGGYFQWFTLIFRLVLIAVCGGAGFLLIQQNMEWGKPAAYFAAGAGGFSSLFTFGNSIDNLINLGSSIGFSVFLLLLLGAGGVALAVVVMLKMLKPAPAGPQQQAPGYSPQPGYQQPGQVPGYAPQPPQPGQAPGYAQPPQSGQMPGYEQQPGYPQQGQQPPPPPGQYG